MVQLRVRDAETKLGENMRVVLRLVDGVLREAGHPHQFLIRYLGTLGGDFTLLPIRFVECRDPECKNYREQMWRNNIEPKFFIYPHDYIMMKRYIMLALGRAWSSKRCEAYNKAVEIATNKETGQIDNQKLVEAKPKGTNRIDWVWFLSFKTEPTKKLSERLLSATGPSEHIGWSSQTEAAITALVREKMDRASDMEDVGSDDDVNEDDFIVESLDNALYKKVFHKSDVYEYYDEDDDEDLDKDGNEYNEDVGKGGEELVM
ncbi:hypothetical protein LINGRAHAP2_LOCUS17949 [Linum grandiflorum]